MGIDLPDLNEIVSALKGDPEPLKEAWKALFRSIRGERDEVKAKVIAEIRELGVEALLEELWPKCPAFLKPLLALGARALINAILKQLDGVRE